MYNEANQRRANARNIGMVPTKHFLAAAVIEVISSVMIFVVNYTEPVMIIEVGNFALGHRRP